MQDELERRNLDKTNPQKPLIAGHPPVSGADYDRSEVAAAPSRAGSTSVSRCTA